MLDWKGRFGEDRLLKRGQRRGGGGGWDGSREIQLRTVYNKISIWDSKGMNNLQAE